MHNFELISKLGEGSYSTVYKVRRKADLKMYALKKVKLKNLSEKEKQNALNEIRILASIKSDHVISYKEAFIENKEQILNLVMEFANKGDLFQKITYYKQMQKSFEEVEIWNIFIQILQGLKCLHDLKILHRDLKSANIFLFNNNLAKIGDLNVSKVAKSGIGHTQTGTPYYASPEVWNDESYTSKSDIWSLGCVIYEMITLRPPFKAESMEGLYHKIMKGKYQKIPDKYSQDLNEILKLMLKVDQNERPSCDELLKNDIVIKRIEFLKQNKNEENGNDNAINSKDENELLKTIKISKNLLFLSGRLPKANYGPNALKNHNLKILENPKHLIKSVTSLNENKENILPSINQYHIKNLRKNLNLNISDESTIPLREQKKNNDIKANMFSSPNRLIKNNENQGNNISKSHKNKKVIISNLFNGKLRNKGMNNLYKMYISKDFIEKIVSPNKKYALYLPQVFTRKKVKEKKSNSDSLVEPKSS